MHDDDPRTIEEAETVNLPTTSGAKDSQGVLVRVDRVHTYNFRVPIVDLDGTRHAPTNFLVQLDVTTSVGLVTGVGEGQVRGADTGDSVVDSWDFLQVVAADLEGVSLEFADRTSAIGWIRDRMLRYSTLARASLADKERSEGFLRKNLRSAGRRGAQVLGRRDPRLPFRGVLFGVETALLDAAGRVLGISVADLLGAVVPSVPTLQRLEIARDGTEAVGLLKHTAQEQPEMSPLWLNLRVRLSPSEAEALVDEVAREIDQGGLRPPVLLEQPFGLRDRKHLRALQKRANTATAHGGIRIMTGGRSVWSVSGLQQVARKGQGGALHIQPASAGGLLASLVLAQEALAADPGMTLVLSLHDGSTEVGRQSLASLAVAMPKLSHVASDSNGTEVSAPEGIGLGAAVPYENLVDSVSSYEAYPPLPKRQDPGPQPNEFPEVTYLQPLGPNGTKGHLLERQALALGLTTRRFSKGAFVASDGVHDPLLIKWSRSPLSSAVSLALCTHKEATRIRLHQAGVPVPRGRTFVNGDLDSARAFAERIGYPVVVKPAMGVRGIGVVANIQNPAELDQALAQLSASKLGDQDVIVEKHIPGNDYRIVVVGREVVAAILREPASVVGDGTSSVAELMIQKNLMRRRNPHLWGRPIMFDDAARYQLQRQQMTLDSIPQPGERVMLSNSNSLSQGGDSTDVLDELHPSIKEASLRAVEAVPGLAFCGVDFLIEDHTKPLDQQVSGICELNAHAAIGNCEYPLYGQPRQVAKAFMEECVATYDLVTHPEPAKTLALRLTVRGRVSRVGYLQWMRRNAETFGVRGWVRNVNRRTVEAYITGDTEPVSALAAAAVLGPRRALPTSVSTSHVDLTEVEGFRIRHKHWARRIGVER